MAQRLAWFRSWYRLFLAGPASDEYCTTYMFSCFRLCSSLQWRIWLLRLLWILGFASRPCSALQCPELSTCYCNFLVRGESRRDYLWAPALQHSCSFPPKSRGPQGSFWIGIASPRRDFSLSMGSHPSWCLSTAVASSRIVLCSAELVVWRHSPWRRLGCLVSYQQLQCPRLGPWFPHLSCSGRLFLYLGSADISLRQSLKGGLAQASLRRHLRQLPWQLFPPLLWVWPILPCALFLRALQHPSWGAHRSTLPASGLRRCR